MKLSPKNNENRFTTCKNIVDMTLEEFADEVEIILKRYENPYPMDIFKWNNKEKLDFNRGRFNQFTYEIVENTRKEFLDALQKLREDFGISETRKKQ